MATHMNKRALEMMRKVWAVDHAMRRLSRAMEHNIGISSPHRLIIRVVGERPGISASALADLLFLDASTLTEHLKHLEEADVIKRHTAEEDGRRTEITLTAKGRKLDVKMPGTMEAAVENALDRSDEKRVAHVEAFLLQLVTELDAQTTLPKPKRRR